MKNWLKPTRIEWITFFALMPVVDVMALYIMFGGRLWVDAKLWLYAFWIGYAVGFATWYMNVIAMHRLQQLMPGIKQTVKRVTLVVVCHILISLAAFSLVFWFYDTFGLFGFKADAEQFRLSIWVVLGMIMLTVTLWEGEFIYKKNKESIIEKETMQLLSIQQEFDTLKSQVNPHFLFNCFNTLSSLISENPRQAEVFLNELSKVYRYLLSSNENGLSTVNNELNFINSYFQLLKTRHGDAIQLQIEVDKKYGNYLLPSLTLQLLLENAVKHNIISKQHPLVIEIFSLAGNKLAVNNNLQRKLVKAPSNKIGLENIRFKYQLLKQPGCQILEDTRNFTVILPLIWNNVNDKQFAAIRKNAANPSLN